MAANDKQVGGTHYKAGDVEHWDMVVHFKLDYFQGQITKYVMRWREKGGVKDLEKAQHVLEKYLEVARDEETIAHYGPISAMRYLRLGLNPRRTGKAGKSKTISGRKLRTSRTQRR